MNRRLLGLGPAAILIFGAVLSACSGGSGTTPTTPASLQQNAAGGSTTETVVRQSGVSTLTGTAPHVDWTHMQKRGTTPSATSTVRQSTIVNSPFNLTYFGGPLVKTMQSHPVYVNCAPGCWTDFSTRGTPGTFLARLATSTFIHVTDQYVGSTANNRYTLGTSAQLSISGLPHTVQLFSTTQVSILAIVHAVASAFGSGYGHEYHVFLPKGTDTCMGPSSPTVCYSPDNPPNWIFCAYHGSVDFSDIHHVLFSVQPYQGPVPGAAIGCADTPVEIPHGTVDTMASTLSHETIETVTDPDGTSWFNRLFLIEIGDECIGFHDDDNISGLYYDIQEEYSNKLNGCANGP
ncbi:MAG TPA: hypothetical protein VFE17_09245 [Candidatus Baltobacteraceae bacterium]|jgi:hypothetical protein|nr:hypothetical protein [Candidatus Baltobacteraceae bacterium]